MKKCKKYPLTDNDSVIMFLHGNTCRPAINGGYGLVKMVPDHKYKLSVHYQDEDNIELDGILKRVIRPILFDTEKPIDPIIYEFIIINKSEEFVTINRFSHNLFKNKTIICFPYDTSDYISEVKTPSILLN